MAASIDLFIVRHAIAAERGPSYPDDRLRPLTPDGITKFRECVKGLVALDVEIDLVFTSPLARARQTADILVGHLARKPALEELPALAPGGKPQQVIDAVARAHRRRQRRIALVGHEPDLSELTAKLLGARGHVEFRKGAVCCLEIDGSTPGGPGTLRWLLPPRVLRRVGR